MIAEAGRAARSVSSIFDSSGLSGPPCGVACVLGLTMPCGAHQSKVAVVTTPTFLHKAQAWIKRR